MIYIYGVEIWIIDSIRQNLAYVTRNLKKRKMKHKRRTQYLSHEHKSHNLITFDGF